VFYLRCFFLAVGVTAGGVHTSVPRLCLFLLFVPCGVARSLIQWLAVYTCVGECRPKTARKVHAQQQQHDSRGSSSLHLRTHVWLAFSHT
jgi:hypothetical protein